MYIKYVTQSISSTVWTDILLDLKGIFEGTITSPNQLNSTYCDTVNSEIVGTLPTNGVYTITSTNTTQLNGTKKYYANNGTFQPEINFTIQSITNGPYLKVSDANGSNSVSASYAVNQSQIATSNNFSQLFQFDLWIGDTGIMFAAQGGSNRESTTLLQMKNIVNVYCDFPYIPSYDDQCFSDNNGYYPGAYFAAGGWGVAAMGSNNTNTNYHNLFFRRNNFRKPDGSFTNVGTLTNSSPSSNYYGYINAASYAPGYPLLFPPSQAAYYPVPTATGTGTILHPCMYAPSWTGHQSSSIGTNPDDTRSGQMLNMFRIADNFGTYRNGDRLQVGSDYYRVIKAHKTGGRIMSNSDSVNTACYAFPENSIAGPS